MSVAIQGIAAGTVLGLIDGLSAWFQPEARAMMIPIVVGSTVKGLITGAVVGFIATRKRSMPLGVAAGAVTGFALSHLAAMGQPDNYWVIVLPGMLVGVIAGIITQRPRATVMAFACAAVLAAPLSAQAPPNDLTSMQFMIGEWQGTSEGQPGSGTVEREYRHILNARFIEEVNRSVYPAQAKNPKGEVHEHRSVLSFDRGRKRVVFRQFHIEGFVNQYLLEPITSPTTRVFVSEALENIPAGYKARETYTLIGADEFEEVFEIAEPGKDFAVYSKARLTRVK